MATVGRPLDDTVMATFSVDRAQPLPMLRDAGFQGVLGRPVKHLTGSAVVEHNFLHVELATGQEPNIGLLSRSGLGGPQDVEQLMALARPRVEHAALLGSARPH